MTLQTHDKNKKTVYTYSIGNRHDKRLNELTSFPSSLENNLKNMPQLKVTTPQVVNQGGSKNTNLQSYLKQQLEIAQKKVDQLEVEINEIESAS